MAIAFPAFNPLVVQNSPYKSIEMQLYPITAAQTYTTGQIVDLVTGALSVVATNPATVTGVADSDAVAIFANAAGSIVAQSLFGTGAHQTDPLGPAPDQSYGVVLPFHNGQQFQFSYNQALAASTVGTAVGFSLASGIFSVDNSVANKLAKIIAIAYGPQNIPGTGAENIYQNGDTGVRVIIQVTSGLTI